MITVLPDIRGAYAAPIQFRHMAADAATSVIWNLRGSVNPAYLKSLRGIVAFDGVAAAGTTLVYGFYRGSGAASPTGGTVLAAEKKRTSYSASTSVVTGNNGLLTTTGITYDANPFAVVAVPASISDGVARFDFQYDAPLEVDSSFVFGADEHLAVILQTNAIIGLGIYGQVEWDERVG